MKTCTKCQEGKPLSEFYKDKKGRDGVHAHCKTCCIERATVWQKNNKEKVNAKNRTWSYKNRAQKTAQVVAWRKGNIDRTAGATRRYRQKYPERYKAGQRLHRAIKSGQIRRPKQCSACQRETANIQGHHPDYTKPLEVIWLCPLCHGKEHRIYQSEA